MEQTYILTVRTEQQDDDLMDKIPAIIRDRFEGTAVTVVSCERTGARNPHWRAGWRAAITQIAEG